MVVKNLILFFFVINLGFSQVNVKVSAEPRTLYEGDSFTLTVSAENGNEMPNVNISNLRDFRVVSGPSQSTNMQWINGKMSSNYSLSWTIIPKKKGQSEIPALNINGIPTRALSAKVIIATFNIPLGEIKPIWMLLLPPEKGTI